MAMPNTDLVAQAWIRTLPGLPTSSVSAGVPSTMPGSGHVQVFAVGGSPHRDVPERMPVLSVDCWARDFTDQQTGAKYTGMWAKASAIAEAILNACYDTVTKPSTVARPVALPAGYDPALVQCVYPLSEPRRVDDPEGGFAHVQFDLQMVWRGYS